jgi:hypothetical protein
MKNSISGIATGLLLLAAAGLSPATAAPVSVTGATALAVAAVVAQYSPLLSAGDKKVIAGLFDGKVKSNYPKKKLSVSADSVMCRISNVAIADRSCEITFGKKAKHSLKGREANELYATLATAGINAEGAAGSMIENVTKFSCTLDPAVIKDNSGGGADCSLEQ